MKFSFVRGVGGGYDEGPTRLVSKQRTLPPPNIFPNSVDRVLPVKFWDVI